MLLENGLPRIGRSARSVRQPTRIAWARRGPMPGATLSSRWSALLVRMISMRRIWWRPLRRPLDPKPRSPTARSTVSRCNANRHGLTAETVLSALEDAEDYKTFEAAITADYDAQSTVERELVLRLASIL